MCSILGLESAANGDRWFRGLMSSTLCRVIGDILQPTHLIFVLVVALLVLGPKRLPEAGRSLGRGLRDFKDALSGDSDDRHVHEELTANDASEANAQAAPVAGEHDPAPSVPVHDPAPSAPAVHDPAPSSSVQLAPADPLAAPGPAAASVGARSAEQSAHD
jgi:sec-independent protein translocase protein TatA